MGGNVHAVVGRMSFSAESLRDNIQAFMDFVGGMKPPSVKGNYVRGVVICGTMTPGIRVAA